MDQGRLTPEALLFSSRFYCLSAEGWLCEPCVCVCVCVCVCMCLRLKENWGREGAGTLIKETPPPYPQTPWGLFLSRCWGGADGRECPSLPLAQNISTAVVGGWETA